MHSATTLPASAPAIPVRDQFAPIKVVFLVGIHLGAVTAVWHSTWAAVGVCLLMHAACGGVGICAGYHLLRVPFYRFLSRAYVALSVLTGALLYILGGWTFVVWGMFVRLVITYHTTWLVNSASHSFGYKNFPIDDLSTNCWWVALLSGG